MLPHAEIPRASARPVRLSCVSRLFHLDGTKKTPYQPTQMEFVYVRPTHLRSSD